MRADAMDAPTAEEAALIARAIAIVGHNPATGRNQIMHAEDVEAWHVEPLRQHDGSAPLIERLKDAEVKNAFKIYDDNDKAALTAQAYYRRLWRLNIWPLIVAVTLALFLVIVPTEKLAAFIVSFWIDPAKDRDAVVAWDLRFRQVLPWIIFSALFASPLLVWIYRLIRRKGSTEVAYTNWQTSRGNAEQMRREIFRRLFETPARPPPSADVGTKSQFAWSLLLRLEYFRRWQVEVQRAYYKREIGKCEGTVKRRRFLAKAGYILQILVGLTLIASALASGDEQHVSWLPAELAAQIRTFAEADRLDNWLIVLALVVSGFAAAFYLAEALSDSVRTSARYKNVIKNFDTLLATPNEPATEKQKLSYLEAARLAAVRGDAAGVTFYIDRVHGIMSLEQNDWVQLGQLEQGISTKYDPTDQSSTIS